MTDLEEMIETRIMQAEPDVEVLMVERIGAERLRVFIDRPRGVDLDTCERVTGHLRQLLDDYALEVSSPGPERPLHKLEHLRRHIGQTVRIRTRERIDGRRSFSGTLTAADEEGVSLVLDHGPITIPHDRIHRSNLVPEGPLPAPRDEGPGGSR